MSVQTVAMRAYHHQMLTPGYVAEILDPERTPQDIRFFVWIPAGRAPGVRRQAGAGAWSVRVRARVRKNSS